MSLCSLASTQACAAIVVALRALRVCEESLVYLVEEWTQLGIPEVPFHVLSALIAVLPSACGVLMLSLLHKLACFPAVHMYQMATSLYACCTLARPSSVYNLPYVCIMLRDICMLHSIMQLHAVMQNPAAHSKLFFGNKLLIWQHRHAGSTGLGVCGGDSRKHRQCSQLAHQS